MKKISVLISIILCSANGFSQNKEIKVSADIENITVYNSSAEINYKKEINLPKGKSTIVFSNLTAFIVANTINVKTSNAGVDIMTVTEKINYINETQINPKLEALEDSTSRITNEIGLLNCKAEALKIEKSFLFKDKGIGGVSKGVSVAEIEKASHFFNKRYAELSVELYNLTEKIKKLQKNLDKFTHQLEVQSVNTSKNGSEITLTVVNSNASSATFNFSFLTNKAGWAPYYDCRYQGANSPIKFIFRANVFNSTGTSWEDVSIKLSTASPTNGFNTPSLNSKSSKVENVDGILFREVQVNNSIAEYVIEHKYSIPSDAKPYIIDVNSFEMAAEFNYLLIPTMDIYGFLMAKIPNWNKYNLMPGTTNVYNKGSFMGKTFLNTYTENDTLSIYLGKDNNIQAIRKDISSNNSKNIIGNYYTEKDNITISIKNTSGETFKIQVLDQTPIINERDGDKFNIENIDMAIFNKKEGLLTWNQTLSSNATSIIEYKYELKSPKDEGGNYKLKPQKFRTISCPSF